MPAAFELSRLDPSAFEHLVNALALKVLGAGSTGFGPGSDGGRDGYFEGEAAYPSVVDRWSGRWYIQSKFHKPHLSADAQSWLLSQIKDELEQFVKPNSKRKWPDIWILATNVDPSATPESGTFDKALALVEAYRPELANRFHIWGGEKVISFIESNRSVANAYYHFLSPGHVLAEIYDKIKISYPPIEEIIRSLIVRALTDQQYTKLEQAGGSNSARPGIQTLFTDLPVNSRTSDFHGLGLRTITRTAAQNFSERSQSQISSSIEWRRWGNHPTRARTWFVKGGPGQGKSTLGQYLAQIQRAALILQSKPEMQVSAAVRDLALEIMTAAQAADYWPTAPRIPVTLELKEYAQWFGRQAQGGPRGILSFLASTVTERLEQDVSQSSLKAAFSNGRWLFILDGLDEVPGDVKEGVAREVVHFVDEILLAVRSDALTVCTSRPQGYGGQLDTLDAAVVELMPLSPAQALACATPVLQIGRASHEADKFLTTLREALTSESIREIMTSPLQAHIMAVVITDGGRPPDRKWQLFSNFYNVIRKREANRQLPDTRLSRLLREGDKLLKRVHSRLGFELHARAETSAGAMTALGRDEFKGIVTQTVTELQDAEVDETVDILMEAATERLVLVSTPDTSSEVRFDIRPLQEFFAAEYIHEGVDSNKLRSRLLLLAKDSHWREVMHFVLSALVENYKGTEYIVAIDVLNVTNNGSQDDANERLFNRRLAVGAIIGSRLLKEGVLEQDKFERHRIGSVIEPLLGTADVDALTALIDVNRPQSRKWLIDYLVERFEGLSDSENIGAAYVLVHICRDQSSQASFIRSRLHTKSGSYLAALLSMLSPPFETGLKRACPTWLTELVVDLLASESWLSLGNDGIEAAFRFIANNKSVVDELSRRGQPDDYRYRLLFCAVNVAQTDRVSEYKENISCNFNIAYKAPDSDIAALSEEPGGASQTALTGALELIQTIIHFGTERDPGVTAENIWTQLAGRPSILSYFPEKITSFLPEQLNPHSRKMYRDLPTAADLSWRFKAGYQIDINFPRPENEDQKGIPSLFAEFPSLAVHVWLSRGTYDFAGHRIIPDRDVTERMLCNLLAEPEVLLNFVEEWGTIVDFAKEHGLDGEAVIMSVPLAWDYVGTIFREIAAFAVPLPDGAHLLPHIIAMLSSYVYGQPTWLRRPSERSMEVFGRDVIGVYLPGSSQPIQQIIADAGFDPIIRAAAGMMYLLLVNEDKLPLGICHLFKEAYSQRPMRWMMLGACLSLSRSIEAGDRMAKRCLGELLHLNREHILGRERMSLAFEHWRQKSTFPFQRAGSDAKF